MIEHFGEHTLAGTIGHWLALGSAAFSITACLSFLIGALTGDEGFRRAGRLSFRAHSAAVIGIIAILFVMLFNHWFEYDYVWKHSNREMPLRYIASCFWEGQEGSFLLWTFWNVVIGNVLLWRNGSRRSPGWETPVMTVFALVQVALSTMLLGIYVLGVRVGSSPFLLVRELPENIGMPWTQLPDYLERIPQFRDGRGLNPLLQNYWMVIHPPTLFLGFASTLVPFAFAIAALWKNRLKEWMAPALPWTFLGVMVLGTGVLMGGAWAYEALSFGGFWAWDPVENMALVPWLTLVGTGHLLLINKRKETSIFTTLLLALGTFLLVLYSTFLTRSGVLGDTSVHSFTGEGMLPGLLVFMLAFVILSTAMLLHDMQWRWYYVALSIGLLLVGAILGKLAVAVLLAGFLTLAMTALAYAIRPEFNKAEDERLSSREFWLFIGSLVLLLSAIQVTWTTSIPVYNLLVAPLGDGIKRAPPVNAIKHYNDWQVHFAIIVCLLVSVGQFLRYKSTDMARFRRELMFSFVGAVLFTILGVWVLGYQLWEARLVALLFASSFCALANASYMWKVLKGALAKSGPSVAHVGFALVLLGALVSTSRQKTISRTVKGPLLSTLSNDFNDSKEMMLYKGDTVPLGEHFVTFHAKHQEGVNLHFDMDYLRAIPRQYHAGDTVRVRNSIFIAKDDHTAGDQFLIDQPAHWTPLDSAQQRVFWHAPIWSATIAGEKEFSLAPLVQLNPRFGNVAEPSTRHRVEKDLYTHIRYAKLDPKDTTDFMPARSFELSVGDTIRTPTCLIALDSLRAVRDSVVIARLGPEYTAYVPLLKVRDIQDPTRWFEAKPVIVYRSEEPVGNKGFELPEARVKVEVASVKGNTIGISVAEQEYVILQAIEFPGINILWIGCVLMAIGTGMAVWHRVKAIAA